MESVFYGQFAENSFAPYEVMPYVVQYQPSLVHERVVLAAVQLLSRTPQDYQSDCRGLSYSNVGLKQPAPAKRLSP